VGAVQVVQAVQAVEAVQAAQVVQMVQVAQVVEAWAVVEAVQVVQAVQVGSGDGACSCTCSWGCTVIVLVLRGERGISEGGVGGAEGAGRMRAGAGGWARLGEAAAAEREDSEARIRIPGTEAAHSDLSYRGGQLL
jgi:hypothetical protein